MRRKSDLSDDELLELYDLAWRQFREDRDIVLGLYNELHDLVNKSPERYVLSVGYIG